MLCGTSLLHTLCMSDCFLKHFKNKTMISKTIHVFKALICSYTLIFDLGKLFCKTFKPVWFTSTWHYLFCLLI